MKRVCTRCLSCLPALLLSVVIPSQVSSEDDRPNVVVIFTDDHGWPDIGSAGIYEDLKTPHLDQLAADGARCTNGYVTAPQCVPSRGGLLAGRDQSRFGLETNGSALEGFNAENTIAERLQYAGYVTGQIGKWHLGPIQEIVNHGFTEVFAKNSNRPAWATYGLDGSDREPGPDETDRYHLDACSDAALAFIDRHHESPFFLYLAYRAPHVPLDAPQEYLDRFPGEMPERRRQALAMISAMDDGVGRIREKLEEKSLSDRTLIFFIGDNGAPLKIDKEDAPGGGPGWDGSLNEPMNGEKGMLSEGGIRVPFLVAWPGTIPAGQVYHFPVSSLDVAATSHAIAGLGMPAAYDGVNLVPFLSGEREGRPHATLVWRWSSQSAIRHGDWKLLRGGTREYLYNLRSDPGETRNLISTERIRAGALRRKLMAWTRELEPPGFLGDQMPEVWEQYFDHYLEGKEVSRKAVSQAQDNTIDGWIVRNGEMKSRPTHLELLGTADRQRFTLFIANSRVRAKGPVDVSVQLARPFPGALSVQWREDGQRDFVTEQYATLSGKGNLRSGRIPTRDRIIHLRVRFVDTSEERKPVHIQSIAVADESGEKLETWEFRREGEPVAR